MPTQALPRGRPDARLLLGQGVNIASFALGRDQRGAVSVLGVDEADTLDAAVAEVRKLEAVREAVLVRL